MVFSRNVNIIFKTNIKVQVWLRKSMSEAMNLLEGNKKGGPRG
jgi:hypothetical protein